MNVETILDATSFNEFIIKWDNRDRYYNDGEYILNDTISNDTNSKKYYECIHAEKLTNNNQTLLKLYVDKDVFKKYSISDDKNNELLNEIKLFRFPENTVIFCDNLNYFLVKRKNYWYYVYNKKTQGGKSRRLRSKKNKRTRRGSVKGMSVKRSKKNKRTRRGRNPKRGVQRGGEKDHITISNYEDALSNINSSERFHIYNDDTKQLALDGYTSTYKHNNKRIKIDLSKFYGSNYNWLFL